MNESLSREVQSRRAAQAALGKREREVERLQREVSAYKVRVGLTGPGGMSENSVLGSRAGQARLAGLQGGTGMGGLQGGRTLHSFFFGSCRSAESAVVLIAEALR